MTTKLRVPTTWKVREPHAGPPRIPFVQRCRLRGPGSAGAGLVCDLSTRGAYVGIEPVPQPGEMFQLTFQLPGDAIPVVVDTVVTWHNAGQKVRDLPAGCGLRFLSLDARDHVRIESLVKAYTATLAHAQ